MMENHIGLKQGNSLQPRPEVVHEKKLSKTMQCKRVHFRTGQNETKSILVK